MMSIVGASNGRMQANMNMFQFKTTNTLGGATQVGMKQGAVGQYNTVQQHHSNQQKSQAHHQRPKTPPQILKREDHQQAYVYL